MIPQIETLDAFLEGAEKGEPTAILLPPSSLSGKIIELSLRAYARRELQVHLVAVAPPTRLPPSLSPTSWIDIGKGKVELALTDLRKLIADIPSTHVVIVDLLGGLPPWVTFERDLDTFVERTAEAMRKKGIRGLWLFRPREGFERTASRLHSFPYVLSVQSAGLVPYGQFLRAGSMFDPTLALPRRVRLSETLLEFDPPSIPVVSVESGSEEPFPEGTPSSGESGPPQSGGPSVRFEDLLDAAYKRVFRNSPDGILLFDLTGGYREANSRACELLGRNESEIQSAPLSSLVPSGQRFALLRALVQLRKKGKGEIEIELLRKSGRPVRVSIAASMVDRGRYMGILRDLTGTTKEAEGLRRSSAHYQSLFDRSPYAQVMIANRKLISCNDAFRDLFGLPYEQRLDGKPLTELVGKEISLLFRDLFGVDAKSLIPRSGIKKEITFPWKEGTRRLEIGAVPIPDAEVRTYHCTFIDVSQHYDVAERASDSEKRYRELIETRSGAIAVIRAGRFLFVNQGFLELYGYGSPGELVGDEVTKLVPQRERSSFLEKCEPANALGGPQATASYTGIRADGTKMDVEFSAETIIFDGGHALLTYHRDVTAQKGLDEQVRRKAHVYHTLDGIIEALATPTGVEALLRAGLDAAIARLGFECGGIYLLDPGRNVFLLRGVNGLSEKVTGTIGEQARDAGTAGYVAKTHESLLLPIAEYPPHLPYRSLFEGEGFEIVAYVPLVSKDEVRGILLLAARRRLPYQVRDAEILNTLGKHLGVALERGANFDRLLEAEGMYRSTVEGLAEALYQTTTSGSYIYLSPRIEAITGYTPDEFRRNGELWRSIVHPDDRSVYSLRVASQSEASESLKLEYRMLPKKKAAYRWVRDTVRYTRDANGRTTGIQGSIADITEEKERGAGPERLTPEREAELIEEEKRLREVVDEMGDAMMISALDGTIVEVNKEFTRLTGYSRARARGIGFPYPWLIDEEAPQFFRWISELREKRFLRDFDMTWRHREGRQSSISLNTTLLRNARGEAVAMLNIARDITERRRLAVELATRSDEVRERNEELILLNEVGAALSGAIDSGAVLRLVSAAVTRVLPLEEFSYDLSLRGGETLKRVYEGIGEGRWVSEGEAADRPVGKETPEWHAVHEGRQIELVEDGKLVLLLPVRRHQLVAGLIRVVAKAGGEQRPGYLRLLENIATLTQIALDRVVLYEETVAKSEEIGARNRELDEFAYVVSHDLKEPLIAIEGYSKIVLNEYKDRVLGEGEQFLGSIVQSSRRMKLLIEDLLTLSRVGRGESDQEVVAVRDVLDGVVKDIGFILKDRNATVEMAEQLPTVRYNPSQLGMVFRNLISNGVKFNLEPAPRIFIDAKEEQAEYHFTVRDNGIGIAPEHFDRIFVIFQRLNRAEEYQGTGAGLTIVKKIVERHGGKIWVESAVGAGTTFHFTVPR